MPVTKATNIIEALTLPALSPLEYTQLKDSIERLGVLVPILRCPDGFIIDGRERLKAIKELGLRKWPERVIGGLSSHERQEYRVRINAERRMLSREQRRALLEAIVRTCPSKSLRELADLCRVSKATAAKARSTVPQRTVTIGRNGKTYKPAVPTENRRQSAEASRLLESVGDDPSLSGGTGLRQLREIRADRHAKALADGPVVKLPPSIRLEHCDFRELQQPVGSVDLALLDPPWTPTWSHHLSELASKTEKLLRPGGIAAVYTGQLALPQVLDAFRAAGLSYHWQIVAMNTFATKNGVRKESSIISRYRSILVFIRGSGCLPKTISDVMDRCPVEEQFHPQGWGQPVAEAVQLIESLSEPGDLVVDLTAGSGTVAVACLQVGRRFVGAEIDKTCYKIALQRIAGKR